jgi:AcrR family transcriptional regulator
MTTNDSTRESLLTAAKKIFAEKGFQGATVKEISEEANVNVSLVSYHFNGKENLFKTCLEEFGNEGLEAATRTLKPAENLEEFKVRFSMFIEEFFLRAIKEADVHTILFRDCSSMSNPIVQEVFVNVFSKIFETVVQFFATAQKKKILNGDFTPRIAAQHVMAILTQTVRMNTLHSKLYNESIEQPKYREKQNRHILKLVLEGLSP